MTCFKLDGHDVPFTDGQTIMAAAAAAGHYIPHLCHHPDFTPHGSCKLCSVRVDGHLHAACTFPAAAGQVVESATAELQADRRRLTQLLFVEGNHYCPFCEKSGNCQLQAVAYHVGMLDSHYPHHFPQRTIDMSHPDVWLDRDRCIFCALCVRASREVDGKSVFDLAGRGSRQHLVVNSPSGQLGDSAVSVQDRAVHVCPTGALLPKRRGFVIPIGQRVYDAGDINSVGNQQPPDPAPEAKS